ncbi:hypothetical protein [Bacillus sp. OAE603]|uniref:hypothetical protein n=1 Tax=Gottfriedia sp. OAE603 TaxID=2663872 RepID=UPI00178B1F31
MEFEVFWNSYKEERSSYRDDAWTEILLWKIKSLSPDDKQVVLEELLSMVMDRRDHWYVALDALEEFGNESHIQVLVDTQKISSKKCGYIIKVLAKRGIAEDLLEEFLKTAIIDSSWRYVVGNLSDKQKHLFTFAFERYFDEGHELEFGFRTFFSYNKDKLELLKTQFKHNAKIFNELNTIT